MDNNVVGIYIHVPFCLTKCPYCDFYSVCDRDGSLKDAYAGALLRQIEAMPDLSADTVYLGGGTPSQLSLSQIGSVIDALSARNMIADGCEITMEANPADCSEEMLSGLKSIGINRLSLGIQSNDDNILRRLGRRHSAAEGLAALTAAARIIGNVSADIMLAVPEQDISSAIRTCDGYHRCGASHISAYLLKCVPGTPFGDDPPADVPDDDQAADIYEAVSGHLKGLGYGHYEISNYALPGRESRHNLKYWDCEDYIGLGPAAHSCYKGKRYSCTPDIRSYIAQNWSSETFFSSLNEEGVLDAEDYIMLQLRLRHGLDLGSLRKRFGVIPELPEDFIAECINKGLLIKDDNIIKLTESGFLVSNSIISEII